MSYTHLIYFRSAGVKRALVKCFGPGPYYTLADGRRLTTRDDDLVLSSAVDADKAFQRIRSLEGQQRHARVQMEHQQSRAMRDLVNRIKNGETA